MPIFNKKLPKMNVAPPPIPQRNEPEEAPVEVEPTADQPGPSTSTSGKFNHCCGIVFCNLPDIYS